MAYAGFDESVEVATHLGVDPRKADQVVRGTVVLPNGTGKAVRVLACICQGDKEAEAQEAGADFVGVDHVAKIKEGWLGFDVCVATPDLMRMVGPLGRILGPRGLMPTPKAGTVTPDVGRAIREIKAGKIEYRVDKTGNLHAAYRPGVVRGGKPGGEPERLHVVGAARQTAGGKGHLCQERDGREHHGPRRADRSEPLYAERLTMTKEQKQAFISDLQQRLERSEAIYLTDFTGLDVQSMTTLRRELKKSSGEYLVVKNRLLRRAMADTEMPDISSWLTGPTGVVFGIDSAVEAARVVVDFAKENGDRPVFKVGVMESGILDPEAIARVSRLPSREELLSQVAGALGGPLSAFVGALGGKLQEMAGLADALREQKESAGNSS